MRNRKKKERGCKKEREGIKRIFRKKKEKWKESTKSKKKEKKKRKEKSGKIYSWGKR